MNKGKFLANYHGDFVDILKVDLPRLVPSVLWDKLDTYRNDPVGMKRYLARHHKTVLYTERSKNKEFYVSGEFAMDEEKMQLFTVRPRYFSDKAWDDFKFEVIITLMHEYVHFMQWLCHEDKYEWILIHKEHSDKKLQEERDYYAAWGEIQAYAHCILIEMKTRNINKPAAKMLMAKRVGYYSPTLKTIRKQFDGFDIPIRYLYREVLRWEKRYERHAEHLNIS